MDELLAFGLLAPPASLLALALLTSRWANGHHRLCGQLVTWIAGLQTLFAATLAIALATGSIGVVNTHLPLITQSPIAVGVHYDGVSALMLALVSFVGWVTSSYSIRYLDGEANQGAYFCWTGFTIGAVSMMVISGNLLMFIAAWVMTSLGLHHLLLHYGHRPAARRAAWTKFTISRLGDVALLGALALIYGHFGTTEFAALLAAIQSPTFTVSPAISVASFLLVAGAITKSAQFPLHTWLPQTMETPTPVSALMHAGIVNAGGYLMIRTSPLVSTTPAALTMLAIIGAITACFAAVVMLTQTSVKKSLAYSTIAQMGFMMLQCGLGAFSAAMLHLLAHSLYKAHAFLSSGSVLQRRAATAGALPADQPVPLSSFAVVATTIIACYAVALTLLGVNPMVKPGGVLLGGVLCLALTGWIGQVLKTGNQSLVIRSLAIAGSLCFAYVISFVVVDKIVAPSLPFASAPAMAWLVAAIVTCGFGAMFLLQAGAPSGRRPAWTQALYVHAANGFYLENLMRRVFGPLASQ